MGETWVSRPIVDVKRDYTVCITNPNEDGLPIAVNIPAEMILMADMVLREACHRGKQSPELRLWHGEGGTGAAMWNCQFGAIRTWSVTPWGALEAMGRQIAALIVGR